jgi:hypothetical protein
VFDPLLVASLVSQFRSSGRFFWIVTYLLLGVSVHTLYSRYQLRTLIPLLVCALALQIVDTLPLQARLRELVQGARSTLLPDQARVAEAFSKAGRVVLVPSYTCAADDQHLAQATGLTEPQARRRVLGQLLDLQLIAAWTGRPINSVSRARASATEHCMEIAREAWRQRPGRGTVTVYLTPVLHLLAGAPSAGAATCSEVSVGVMCVD